MKLGGILLCGVSGATGASVGYFVPGTVAAGFVVGALALGFGATDFVIKDSLKLVDDRIKAELGEVGTAFRRVMALDCTRRALVRLNLVAMVCKGLAMAVAGLATQEKASPAIMATGCGALAFGIVLTAVIFLSHEHYVTVTNRSALERAEAIAAKSAVTRLGQINEPITLPERSIIELKPGLPKKTPPKKAADARDPGDAK